MGKPTCAGCDAELDFCFWQGEIVPGHRVSLCGRGRRGGYWPHSLADVKKSCLVAAREKSRRCAACGAESHRDYLFAPVCDKCLGTVARHERAEDAGEVVIAILRGRKMFPYLPTDEERDVDWKDRLDMRLARQLAEAVECPVLQGEAKRSEEVPAGKGGLDSPGTYEPRILVTRKQLDALQQLVGTLREIFEAERRSGFKDGDGLLGRLARGEVTVADYEEESGKGKT